MNLFHGVERRKQIGLVSPRSRTTNVDACNCTAFGQNHRAARGPSGFGVVTNFDALDVSQTAGIGRWHS
jgi:hypothetical protein